MNILIAQLAHIAPSTKVFDKYLRSAFKGQKKIDLIVLGDFVANHFFKEYRTKSSIKREFEASKKYFLSLAKKHKSAIVAPIIEWDEGQIFKSILVAESNCDSPNLYRASRLMDFPHWDERAFFDNETLPHPKPLIFNIGDFKVSAIFGWEAHFDEIMIALRKKGVDILCVPCANTFGSNMRWQRLMQIRAFLNSCVIIRANRVGEFVENDSVWDFYGESFIALPDGSLGDMMGEKEGILISEIEWENVENIKNLWRFR